MARSHSHNVKIGEGRKARRRKRKQHRIPEYLRLPAVMVAWVCNDASCVQPHCAG